MKQKSKQFVNNKIGIYAGIILLVGFLAGYILFQWFSAKNNVITQQTNIFNGVNRGNDQAGRNQVSGIGTVDELLRNDMNTEETLSVDAKKALEEAIIDEYKAFSTYQAVINKFGSVRPFSMIIRAEEQHIALLKALFETYNLAVPENIWLGTIIAPSTLKEACQIGVDAEIANAQLYKIQLLPAVIENSDITSVFENLMNASQQSHLPAFEKCN